MMLANEFRDFHTTVTKHLEDLEDSVGVWNMYPLHSYSTARC